MVARTPALSIGSWNSETSPGGGDERRWGMAAQLTDWLGQEPKKTRPRCRRRKVGEFLSGSQTGRRVKGEG
jgi:hypothetical protein